MKNVRLIYPSEKLQKQRSERPLAGNLEVQVFHGSQKDFTEPARIVVASRAETRGKEKPFEVNLVSFSPNLPLSSISLSSGHGHSPSGLRCWSTLIYSFYPILSAEESQ